MKPAPDTRQRLLDAASELFARSGFRGASVRDICDAARANPGAISYHFGSKRQLYRAVLRRAAAEVAESVPGLLSGAAPPSPERAGAAVARALARRPDAFRLLLRDLAEGADGAVESFAPALGSGFENLVEQLGIGHEPPARTAAVESVLSAVAPGFLLLAAWPVLHRALDLPQDSLGTWLERLTRTPA
ncbi:MAG TPA: TetR/AcrR family transcriptional regulator [Acidobacteria bacterium]|nr:TetR/AcrR family transcriptional regulator [Acidobacteriota bacterium]